MFPCQKVGVVDYLGTWDYCSYLCNFVFPIGLLTYEQAYFVKYVTDVVYLHRRQTKKMSKLFSESLFMFCAVVHCEIVKESIYLTMCVIARQCYKLNTIRCKAAQLTHDQLNYQGRDLCVYASVFGFSSPYLACVKRPMFQQCVTSA